MDKFLSLNPENEKILKRSQESKKQEELKEETREQPWVEKYRPNKLDDIVYQENIIKALKRTKETGKMQHLLFYGPPGTGKTSTILAVKNKKIIIYNILKIIIVIKRIIWSKLQTKNIRIKCF
jgi:replication factor C subunit 2/4